MGTSPGSPGGSSRTPPPSQRSLPFPRGPREMQPPPPIRGTKERTGSRCILTRPSETHTHRSTRLPPRASYRPRHRGSSRVPGMQGTAWALERRLQPPRVAAWSSGRRCSWDWPGAGAGARFPRVRPARPGSASPRPRPLPIRLWRAGGVVSRGAERAAVSSVRACALAPRAAAQRSGLVPARMLKGGLGPLAAPTSSTDSVGPSLSLLRRLSVCGWVHPRGQPPKGWLHREGSGRGVGSAPRGRAGAAADLELASSTEGPQGPGCLTEPGLGGRHPSLSELHLHIHPKCSDGEEGAQAPVSRRRPLSDGKTDPGLST